MLLRDLNKLSYDRELAVEKNSDFNPSFEEMTFGFVHQQMCDVNAVTVLIELFTTLEELLLKNCTKLSAHPAFDKLWLETLTFLVSVHETGQSSEIYDFSDRVKDSIKRLNCILESSLTQKIGLKAVTLDYIGTILNGNTL